MCKKVCVTVFSLGTCGYSCTCAKVSYYRKLTSDKINSVFQFNFIERVCSSVREYRRKTRLMMKVFMRTPDGRERDQGVPNPWFTGPPRNLIVRERRIL